MQRGRGGALTSLREAPWGLIALAFLSLADALQILVNAPGTGLPVLDDTRTALVGWVTHQAVLAALRPADGGDDRRRPARPQVQS